MRKLKLAEAKQQLKFGPCLCLCNAHFFKRFLKFIFRERGKEREREGEKNIDIDVREKRQLATSHMPPTRDLSCNPSICPDWESNWWPFGLQVGTQHTEPHQPGLCNAHFNLHTSLTNHSLLVKEKSGCSNKSVVLHPYWASELSWMVGLVGGGTWEPEFLANA